MTEGTLRREEGGFPTGGSPPGGFAPGGSDAAGLGHLLQRIAGGDRAALRRLYDLKSPRLYAIALRITREKELASDALHDAFMQVLKQAGRFDPARGSAEAWLVSLVRYRALDIVRGRGREVLGYEPADQPGFEPDALDLLAATEEGARLRTCLGALEEDRRRLIMLAFVDGLSHNDLAARLSLPLGTVKSAIRRGLLTLRECLGQ
ncbi:MAG: sigma-70 family RNA polymerase sigma factor [Acetobacteraceae bacterium]